MSKITTMVELKRYIIEIVRLHPTSSPSVLAEFIEEHLEEIRHILGIKLEGGAGSEPKHEGKVICPVCKGSGIYKDDECPNCEGEKYVHRLILPPAGQPSQPIPKNKHCSEALLIK